MKLELEGDLLKELKKGWNQRLQWLRMAGYIVGGIFVIFGILFLFTPLRSAIAFKTIVALAILALGIARLFEYFLAPVLFRFTEKLISGIFGITIGVVLLQMSAEVALTVFSALIGIYLLVSGITKLTRAAQLRALGVKDCGWLIVDGAFRAVIALLFFLMPMSSIIMMNVVLGLFLLVDGLSIIIETADSKTLRQKKANPKKLASAKEAKVVKKK